MTAKIIRSISALAILSINVLAVEEIPFFQGEYDPAKWPAANLRLSQAGTLKDVFDSGLRPYRFPGLENSTLEVKHIRLVTHLASGKVLPAINAEWINIKMFDDGELAHMEGATPQLSLEQARIEMLKWLPYGPRPTEDLDNYLKAVKADPLDFDDPFRGLPDGCAVGWEEPGYSSSGGGPGCDFWFRKTFSGIEPLKLYFKFSWGANRPSKMRTGYRIPIPPPPGYEHVSMKAPEKFGPDSGVDINRSKGISIGESPEARRAYEEAKKEAAVERAEKRQPVTSNESSDINSSKPVLFPWWLIASSVAILAFAFTIWLHRRKSDF